MNSLSDTEIDIILLKFRMPDGSGLNFVQELRKLYPHTKVIILLEEAEEFWEALQIDADGYEVRHMPTYQLAAALRAIADGYGWMGPMLSRYLLKRGGRDRLVDAASRSPVDEQIVESLSAREREVLYLLSEGLKGEQIAEKLHISPKTVKLHISSCIRKLNVEDRTQAIAKFLRSKK